MDEARLEELVGTIAGFMTGGAACFGIWLGDELGLYRVMAGAGRVNADEVAAKAGCNPRLVREWLDSQAAAGLVSFDPDSDRYELGDEAAMALADDESPAFVARGMNAFGAFFMDIEKIKAAFRGDGGLSWGDHHPCLFKGTEWFFRTGYRAFLPAEWIPALDGVEAKLRDGAKVADVGCGHGGLHDMGDPVGIARYAREHLEPDGAVLLVEPFALDGRATNIAENPMAALLYAASSAICTPNSLSQEVGLGLGAQAGEARLREVFEEAGFTRFRKAAETPLNLILEAKP